MANPWLKFYTSDWRSDPALRMCSLAARGLWTEMICVMHEAHPYGHLLVNGQSPTDAQLAVLVGAQQDQVTAMLGELESAGVFSRTRSGVIYSRKLTRMAKKAATARNNGRKGGNPKLSEEREKSASDKGILKDQDKPQIPEARSQSIPDTIVSGDFGADRSSEKPPENITDKVWNRGVPFLVERGSSDRQARSLIGKWMREHSPQEVHSAFTEAAKSRTQDPIPYITEILKPQRTNTDVMRDVLKRVAEKRSVS